MVVYEVLHLTRLVSCRVAGSEMPNELRNN